MKTDPREWTVELGPDGYCIVDEYGEEHGNGVYADYKTACEKLDQIIVEEIAAYQEWAYDQAQERLMETGGGPSLLEQQREAWKIKHGFKS